MKCFYYTFENSNWEKLHSYHLFYFLESNLLVRIFSAVSTRNVQIVTKPQPIHYL